PGRPACLAGPSGRDREPQSEAAHRRRNPPHPQGGQGARHPHPQRSRRAALAAVRRAVRRSGRGRRHPRARRRSARGKIQVMKPEIIITAKGHAGTMASLQSEFNAHNLFDASDKESFIEKCAPSVRGMATFGPMPVDGKLMDALPKLEIISNFGVGVDAINLDDARRRRIIVTNTPDVLNECVADTALALILNTVRKFPQSEV